jgi:uncharacterized membrane protein YqaE (UPF0057 family)
MWANPRRISWIHEMFSGCSTINHHHIPSLPDAQSKEDHGMELVKILFALLLPPLGVFLQVGIGKHFWINILLTILGYIPGIAHAVWVVAKKK